MSTVPAISSRDSRPCSRNGLLLFTFTFLFVTTFVLLTTDSPTVMYTNRQAASTTAQGRIHLAQNHSDDMNTPSPLSFKHGCYDVTQATPPIFTLLPGAELERLQCSKREPLAIIIGSKKCGTTTLKNFLSYHPDVAFAERELKFLNNRELLDYRALMPYSTPYQVPMEKTPGYFIRLSTARRLRAMLPDTKLIVILRDPVKRAISDYVHMRYVDTTRRGGAILVKKGMLFKTVPRYEVLDSFERSVLHPNGSLKEYNWLLDSGIYVKYFRQWLQYFPAKQFLVLDGETFVKNPSPTINEVEDFLGVGHYFTDDHFYYDEEKRFYCLKKPVNTCMSSNKGRPHPVVNQVVLDKLKDYFRPHNEDLQRLLNRTFSWS